MLRKPTLAFSSTAVSNSSCAEAAAQCSRRLRHLVAQLVGWWVIEIRLQTEILMAWRLAFVSKKMAVQNILKKPTKPIRPVGHEFD